MVAVLAFAVIAYCDEVSPYDYNFDSAYGVVDDNGQYTSTETAPPGWGHKVDQQWSYSGMTTVPYRFDETGGVDGTGAVYVGSQTVESSYGGSVSLNDLLVTPSVSGKVTIKVKKYYSSGKITFYNVTKDGDYYTVGDSLKVDVSNLTTDDYTTITISSNANGEFIGIRGEYVYLDDFHADKAVLNLKPALTISNVSNDMGEYHDCDEEGNYTLQFKVVVTNTGETVLSSGDEGYSLSIVDENDSVLSTTPIKQKLNIGESSDTISISAVINIANYPPDEWGTTYTFNIVENVTSTSETGSDEISLTPHNAVLTIKGPEDYSPLTYANGSIVNFSSTKEPVTAILTFHNDGGSPILFSSIDVPSGFSVNVQTPWNVEPHTVDTLVVTMNADAIGEKTGELRLVTDSTIALNLRGYVADTTKWFENFEADPYAGYPAYMLHDENCSMSYTPNSCEMPNNHTSAVINEGPAKVVGPRLSFKSGDKLYFTASKKDDQSYLKVLYSTDRKNWTTIHTISAEEGAAEVDTFSSVNIYPDKEYGTVYDFGGYLVDNIPSGEGYIAFEGNHVEFDDINGGTIVNVPHDVYVISTPDTISSMVNRVTNGELTVRNLLSQPEDSDKYTVKVYLDGKEVGSGTSKSLASGEDVKIPFTFTPHEEGEHTALIKLLFEGYETTSDTIIVNVQKEDGSDKVRVGLPNGKGDVSPVDLGFTYSTGEVLYRAEDLQIPVGTRITAASFKGYSPGVPSANLKVWIANTPITSYTENKLVADTDTMMLAYNNVATLDNAGYSTDYYSPVTLNISGDLFTINFDKPFIYTGKSIVMRFHSVGINKSTAYFEQTDNENLSLVTSTNMPQEPTSPSFGYKNQPVIYLTTDHDAKVLTGVVADSATLEPIKGASISLVSGDVLYKAETDDEGKYAIPVFQYDQNFSLLASAEGYNPFADSLIISNDTVEYNITLAREVTSSISIIYTKRFGNSGVYTLSGIYLGNAGVISSLKPGVYIINRRKVVVK